MKLILLNAPPRSGKDAIALYLFHNHVEHPVVVDRLSMPIKQAFAGLMSASIDDFGNVSDYEADKSSPIPLLGNASYRQWQIDFSEKFIKPLYGKQIFSKLLIERLHDYAAAQEPGQPELIVAVPDCGFQLEFDTLLAELPGEDIALFHIHRPLCTWEGDNREWVRPPTYGLNSVFFRDIDNTGTLDDLYSSADRAVAEFLNRKPE